MDLLALAKQYNVPLDTLTKMDQDGVLLTPLLTPKQVSTRYQVKEHTIYSLVKSGDLPARRIKGSRLIRFAAHEIEAGTPETTTPNNVLEMKR